MRFNKSIADLLWARLRLANTPTPVQQYSFRGSSFLMKRDDLTGMETSGNKIRKLEYIMRAVVRGGHNLVVTCGGEQSNHARATAAVCARLGIPCRLLLWGKKRPAANGNLLLDALFGAEIECLNKAEYFGLSSGIEVRLNEYRGRGFNPFFIPEGGSSASGILGYAAMLVENYPLYQQKKVQGILAAAGSGGTAAGLLLGTALFGLRTKIFAVNVLYSESELREKILTVAESAIREFDLSVTLNERQLEIVPGYSIEGYKYILPEKLKVIREFAASSGIVLDPAYTGKAFCAFTELFLSKKKPASILFLHTGGLFGVFPKGKEYLAVPAEPRGFAGIGGIRKALGQIKKTQ